MANEYGWSDDLEANVRANRQDVDILRQAYRGIAATEGDATLVAWANLEWAGEQLAWVGSDAGPELYQQLLEVVPQGYAAPGLYRRWQAAANGSPEAGLWNDTDSALASLCKQLFPDVNKLLGPKLDAWRKANDVTESGTPANVPVGASDFYGEAPSGSAAADEPPPPYPFELDEPPPSPAFAVAPATLDECWVDPAWGEVFRQWALTQPVAAEINFCVAVEQTYVPEPSATNALAVLTTFLLEGADEPVLVSQATVEAVMAALPDQDADPDAPLDGGLFATAHSEACATLEPWYESFRAMYGDTTTPETAAPATPASWTADLSG